MAAFKHSTPRRPSRSLRDAIFARDGYRCAYCGAADELTTDHVLAWSRRGETLPGNLVCCCLTCNETKAGWPVDLFAELCERDGKGRKGAILRRIFRLLRRPLPKP
jgi:5-methylcytosine-specific restriction endonuclease McrA